MDILHLVDRLEELLNQSRPLWFTHNVIVDEDRMLDIIDQMRVAIRDEVKKAQQLLAQSDRVIAQAQEEATRTLAIAAKKANSWLSAMPSFRLPRRAPTRLFLKRGEILIKHGATQTIM